MTYFIRIAAFCIGAHSLWWAAGQESSLAFALGIALVGWAISWDWED